MTTEEKFYAAVNVIRSLPKNGAYQPSHDLQLKFYSYFKQATEGPCSKSKPAFWDVVGKMKWEAWCRLGNMPKEESMNAYVEELKKIVETMSYNDNIGTFLGSLGSFYDSVPVEDIEMLLGPVLERVRSQPGSPLGGSPLGSRETSPTRVARKAGTSGTTLTVTPLSSASPSPHPPDTDDEDEEFIDTVETTPHVSRKSYKSLNSSPTVTTRQADSKMNGHVANGHANGLANGSCSEEEDNVGSMGTRSRTRERESPSVARRRGLKPNGVARNSISETSDSIREAVLHLQKDLDRITARVRTLEVAHLSQPQTSTVAKRKPKWWLFPELSPKTAMLVFAWPIIVHYFMVYMQNRRRRFN